MYSIKADYSPLEVIDRRQFLKGAAAIGVLTGLDALVGGCAGQSANLLPDTQAITNTGSKIEKKIASYDISGDWEYISHTEVNGAIVNIQQKGNTVEASWKSGKSICRSGTNWFFGKVAGNEVRGVRYLCDIRSFDQLYAKINESGDSIIINILVKGTPSQAELRRIKEK